MIKSLKILFSLVFISFIIAGCGGDSNTENNNSNNGNSGTDVTPDGDDSNNNGNANANTALSVWDGHSIRTESGNGGKWLASVSFGEEMTLLGEQESSEKTKKDYEKVRLLDGKEGWIRNDLIHKGGELAAVKSESQIYKRPAISNITDDVIGAAEIVVIKQKKDEFSEFIGKNNKAGKRKRGWVLGKSALTSNETDVAAAIMLSKAQSEGNPIKRKKKLEQIINSDIYSGSAFVAVAQAMLDEAEAGSQLSEDQLMVTGDNVNVRAEPDTEQDNKLFQLSSGDIVSIVQKGEMAEIGGKLDYWYKISQNGQEGWIFGTFTSKAM